MIEECEQNFYVFVPAFSTLLCQFSLNIFCEACRSFCVMLQKYLHQDTQYHPFVFRSKQSGKKHNTLLFQCWTPDRIKRGLLLSFKILWSRNLDYQAILKSILDYRIVGEYWFSGQRIVWKRLRQNRFLRCHTLCLKYLQRTEIPYQYFHNLLPPSFLAYHFQLKAPWTFLQSLLFKSLALGHF